MVGICKISKNFNTQIQYGWLLKSIYQERKKVKTSNVTIWNIMIQGHLSFVFVWNCSRNFDCTDKRSWNSES